MKEVFYVVPPLFPSFLRVEARFEPLLIRGEWFFFPPETGGSERFAFSLCVVATRTPLRQHPQHLFWSLLLTRSRGHPFSPEHLSLLWYRRNRVPPSQKKKTPLFFSGPDNRSDTCRLGFFLGGDGITDFLFSFSTGQTRPPRLVPFFRAGLTGWSAFSRSVKCSPTCFFFPPPLRRFSPPFFCGTSPSFEPVFGARSRPFFSPGRWARPFLFPLGKRFFLFNALITLVSFHVRRPHLPLQRVHRGASSELAGRPSFFTEYDGSTSFCGKLEILAHFLTYPRGSFPSSFLSSRITPPRACPVFLFPCDRWNNADPFLLAKDEPFSPPRRAAPHPVLLGPASPPQVNKRGSPFFSHLAKRRVRSLFLFRPSRLSSGGGR